MNRMYSSTLKKKLVSIILILLLISPSIVSNAYSFTRTNDEDTEERYSYKNNKYFSDGLADYNNNFYNYDYDTKDYFKNWKDTIKENKYTEEIIDNEEKNNTEENSVIENATVEEKVTIEENTSKENLENEKTESVVLEDSIVENSEIQNVNLEDYMGYMTELNIFTELMNTNTDINYSTEELMNKISELQEKYNGTIGIPELSDKISTGITSLPEIDTETLINTVTSFLEENMKDLDNFGDINFDNIDFGDMNFGDIDLGNMDFGDINFGDMDLGNMDFGDMNFGDMDLGNMDFGNIDFGGITGGSTGDFTPDIVVSDMMANTAGRLSGENYRVKLSGNIFFSNPDENGNPTSNKWVVLVHGFLMSGESITNTLGQMYLDQGFNILAPDMRGFGNSEGSVALGYLESLDMWDWITYINENYSENCDEIIVHGLSLGGATTVFLSGLEVDGETLKDKKVIGLIEDCGYSSMSEIVATSASTDDPKAYIMDSLDVGLTEENFDELENGLNSIAKCSVPLLIVHGTDDTTVPYENSDRIYNAAVENENIPYVQRYSAEGQGHAFIFMGTNYDEYKGHVETFINKAEEIKNENEVTYEYTVNYETETISTVSEPEEIEMEENEEGAVLTTETTNNYFSTNTDTTFSAFPFFNMIPNSINIFRNLF